MNHWQALISRMGKVTSMFWLCVGPQRVHDCIDRPPAPSRSASALRVRRQRLTHTYIKLLFPRESARARPSRINHERRERNKGPAAPPPPSENKRNCAQASHTLTHSLSQQPQSSPQDLLQQQSSAKHDARHPRFPGRVPAGPGPSSGNQHAPRCHGPARPHSH
jgi:hypothetical protein